MVVVVVVRGRRTRYFRADVTCLFSVIVSWTQRQARRDRRWVRRSRAPPTVRASYPPLQPHAPIQYTRLPVHMHGARLLLPIPSFPSSHSQAPVACAEITKGEAACATGAVADCTPMPTPMPTSTPCSPLPPPQQLLWPPRAHRSPPPPVAASATEADADATAVDVALWGGCFSVQCIQVVSK